MEGDGESWDQQGKIFVGSRRAGRLVVREGVGGGLTRRERESLPETEERGANVGLAGDGDWRKQLPELADTPNWSTFISHLYP